MKNYIKFFVRLRVPTVSWKKEGDTSFIAPHKVSLSLPKDQDNPSSRHLSIASFAAVAWLEDLPDHNKYVITAHKAHLKCILAN